MKEELLKTLRALESECRIDATDAMNHQYYQYFDGKADGVAQAIEIVKAFCVPGACAPTHVPCFIISKEKLKK